jgi:fatty acid desaturase
MAAASFRTADRLLGPAARPELQSRLASVAAEDRRAVLRHAAAEQNRWMFRTWTRVEVVLVLLLAWAVWPAGTAPRVLALVAAAAVIAQAAGLAPAISELGRRLDFVPRPLPAADARGFGLLHAGYMLADVVKLVVLATTAILLARRGS